jgi:predicted amidohydrolase YtcJ
MSEKHRKEVGILDRSAEYLLTGNVLNKDCSETAQGYVAVSGNRILAVGAGAIPDKLMDGNTEVMDFGRNMIMPAFHDVHTHILQGTLSEEGALLSAAESEEEAAQMLAKTISSKRYDAFWILGGAWDHFKWKGRNMPSKESLDRYFPDRPVFLLNKECHGAWVNSQTLAYFNITKDTPDPENGKIFRDEAGNPTGYLHENAALNVISYIYDVSDFEHLDAVKKFSARTAQYGITSVSDMQIYNIMKYYGCHELEKRGELNVRVHFCPPWTEAPEKLKYLKKMFCSEKLRFSGAKGFIDGTPMGYTGLMVEAYNDRPGFFGEATLEFEQMQELVTRLDANDIRCRLHACGDGAVRWALDIFEHAAKENGKKDIRHTIEHIECMIPADAARFHDLNIIASVQPDHMPKYDFPNHPFHAILGEDRLDEAWSFHSVEKNGGILAFGTDYPIAPLNPMRGVYRAVTRCTDDVIPVATFSPHEKLSLQSALKAYTQGSAFCNFREDDLGTLEPGKLADIVILNNDLTQCETARILSTEVAATVMDGKFIYRNR